jgi:hypothetical protein
MPAGLLSQLRVLQHHGAALSVQHKRTVVLQEGRGRDRWRGFARSAALPELAVDAVHLVKHCPVNGTNERLHKKTRLSSKKQLYGVASTLRRFVALSQCTWTLLLKEEVRKVNR